MALRLARRLLRYLLLATWTGAGLCGGARAAGPPLTLARAAWRAVQPGDTPAKVRQSAVLGEFRRFDPARMTSIPSQGLGSWVVLYPMPPGLPGARVLSIPSPPFGRITLYGPDGPVATGAITAPDPALPAHGRLAFALPESWLPTQPILLKFGPSTSLDAPVVFRLQTHRDFRRSDTDWLVMASASFGVMLAMALVALCFAGMLNDATFAWYALYVSTYAGLQSVQTGFLFQPLHLYALAPMALPLGIALTTVSVIAAVLFMVRFCDLRRYAPWLRNLMLSMAAILAMLAIVRLFDIHGLRGTAQVLLNPLLALCAGLMILSGSVALLRGSRPALFFLFGWLPLLVLTALSSAQVNGALPEVDWLNQASLAAGAIEAVVLAIGLADRTLNLRRDHHLARELADKDPLTGILNRRGWIDAAQQYMDDHRTHTLLFMDLDHFKTINDRLGHTSGDHALTMVAQNLATELRPQDLLCRFGGEEFVALLYDTEGEPARHVAQRLCRRLHRMEIPLGGEDKFLTLSIGMATRRPDDSLSSLVERADAAMYMAKAQGRNRVVDDQEATRGRRPLLRADEAGTQAMESVG